MISDIFVVVVLSVTSTFPWQREIYTGGGSPGALNFGITESRKLGAEKGLYGLSRCFPFFVCFGLIFFFFCM